MKKIKNIFALLVVALVGLSLTACSNDDLGTNQYQGGVSLNAYGPNPVMRGGQLRFVGSNLDQIASITIPGVGEITNFDVLKAGVPSEIRITVPKDGPKVGYVTLKTKTDQTITTKTQLEYIEGVEVTKIPEETVMPGETIKIEGDYLDLINSMAFADGVLVSFNDFVSQDRYYIEVKVPEEAKTGKLEFYTADLTIQRTAKEEDELTYQTIVSEKALSVGLPSISKIVSPRGEAEAEGEITVKSGEEITLNGDYFNVVSAIKFGDVEVTDFSMSEDGTALKFKLPAEAPAGVFNLVCKSGEEVPVASLVTVKPSECVAAPNPVKALGKLTITGKDMDLVTAVQFEGADAVTGDNLNVAADKVVVALVPETATEGTLKLVMANGETVEVAFTLVKPVATAYNANPVSAGAELKITGTNLDLVKSVTFGEATATLEEGAVSADGTTLTVTVPMEATSGKPKLDLANGTSVEAPELTINEAVFCYITQMPDFEIEDNIPAAGDVFTVPVKNADKLTNVYVNDIEVKYVYSEKNSNLTFGIPEKAKAKSVVKLVSSNGEISYNITVKPSTSISKVIFTGPASVGSWTNNLTIPVDAFKDLPEGEVTMVISYAVEAAVAKVKFNDGHWKNIKLAGCVGESEYFFEFDPNETKAYIPLSTADINHLTDPSILDWGGSMFINGQNVTLNKIELVIEIPQEIDIATFAKTNNGDAITYPFTFTWSAVGQINLTKAMLNEIGVKKGSKFLVYKDASNKGQVQINNSSWVQVYTIADWAPDKEVLEQVFDDAMIEALNGGGFWIQSDLAGVKKIAILP
ncbi:MAG: hypothetical protein IKZ62_02725 [Prevotella sp.]|nr:hypothetical protein [Prevotella sp.]